MAAAGLGDRVREGARGPLANGPLSQILPLKPKQGTEDQDAIGERMG